MLKTIFVDKTRNMSKTLTIALQLDALQKETINNLDEARVDRCVGARRAQTNKIVDAFR